MKFITILLVSFMLFCCSTAIKAQSGITVSNVTPLTANTNGLAATAVGGAVGVSLPISACPNDQLLITVDTQGVFGSNNILTAQLVSDPTGGLGGIFGGLLGGLGGGLGNGFGGGLGGLGGGLGIGTPPAPINIGATQPGGSILDPIGGFFGGLLGGITSGGLTGGGLTGGGLPTGGITSQTIIGTIPADIANGTYYLRVVSSNPVDTSANYTSSISIQRAVKPTISMSCAGDSTLLTSGINLGSSYSWSTGSTASSIKVPNTTENYSLTITNTSGCRATSDTSVISNTIVMECNTVMTLSSVVTADAYLWSTNSTENSIVLTNAQAANTLISLSTIHPFTCAAIYSPECLVPVGRQEVVDAPNVFTPNNDNINDLFIINNAGNNIKSISIYNSWGTKVFQTETPIAAWDGRNKFGEECTEGTYYYVLEPISIALNNISTTGFFQLMR